MRLIPCTVKCLVSSYLWAESFGKQFVRRSRKVKSARHAPDGMITYAACTYYADPSMNELCAAAAAALFLARWKISLFIHWKMCVWFGCGRSRRRREASEGSLEKHWRRKICVKTPGGTPKNCAARKRDNPARVISNRKSRYVGLAHETREWLHLKICWTCFIIIINNQSSYGKSLYFCSRKDVAADGRHDTCTFRPWFKILRLSKWQSRLLVQNVFFQC